MQKIFSLWCVLMALCLSACSNMPVNQAKGAAKAGQTYVDTLQKVNVLALNESLGFTADLLPNLPRTSQTLAEQTTEMKTRVDLLNQASAYFEQLGKYFTELETLAQANDKDALGKPTGEAASELAQALQTAPLGLKLSADQKKNLSGLARFVVARRHNGALEQALLRDADAVAQAIALSEAMLDEQIRWINLREKLERKMNYNDKVLQPFVSGKALSESWKQAWIADVKKPASLELLVQAKAASQDMQKAWLQVLQGSQTPGQDSSGVFARVQARLAEMNETIGQLTKADK